MNETFVIDLFERLAAADVRLSIEADGRLKVSAPQGTPRELLDQLRERKDEVAERLRAASPAENAGGPAAGCASRQAEVLSPMQRSLWLTCQIESETIAYNMPHAFEIIGAFDVERMRDALVQVHRRHASLRTRFFVVDGEPRQFVDEETPLDFRIDAIGEADVSAALAAEAVRVFDLERGPLFVARIFRIASDRHVMLFNTHHIVFDGWSCGIVLRELAARYRGDVSALPPPPPFDYADFSHWLAAEKTRRHDRAANYWRETLRDLPAMLDLPTDLPRPARLGSRGDGVDVIVPDALARAAKDLCARRGVTLNQLLFSVFQTLLFRYSGQADFAIGVPAANRPHVEFENLVGYFVNPIPVRQRLVSDMRFDVLLEKNRIAMLEVLAYQDFPFEEIVAEHNPVRSLGHAPVFQHMFSFQSRNEVGFDLPESRVAFLPLRQEGAKYDVLFAMHEADAGLVGGIQFNVDVFERASVERWARSFLCLLEAVCQDPGVTIGTLPVADPFDLDFIARHLDRRWSSPLTLDGCLQSDFERCARARPQAIALRHGDTVLTYAELDSRSDAYARHLHHRGVVGGELVGLCLPRTPALIVGLIGILKSGAAYVPLDPRYPPQRLRDIVEEARLRYLLTDREHDELLACTGAVSLLVEDIPAAFEDSVPLPRPVPGLSHVIYTSGSTGRPKGVMISHRNVRALLEWVRETYPDEALASVLCSTSVCFDISVFEIWAPLGAGGCIELVENAIELCQRTLPELRLINTVPSALRLLVDEDAIPRSVGTINVAGEPLPMQLVNDLFSRRPDMTLYNLYGPTEDTTYSTWARFDRPLQGVPPIGTPLPGTCARILDRHGVEVPVGAIGELFLGGEGVSSGYLHRDALTAERFIRQLDPKGAWAVEYRTGDLVRLRNDGRLHYIGRADNQIKLRGFRIELEEVEHALRAANAGGDACAMVRRDASGDRLVAYLVESGVSREAIDDALRQRLPEYMVPSAYLILDALPLNANGKVDRGALAQIAPREAERPASAGPSNAREAEILEIWKTLLAGREIGVHDSFFQIGGNSLLAMQMISRVNRRFDIALKVGIVFERNTVALLSEHIASPDIASSLPLSRIEHGGEIDASYPQLGAWGIANMEGFRTFYNMVSAVRLQGELDVDALRRSIGAIVARHESLRGSFVMGEGGGIRMRIADALDVPLPVVPLEAADEDAMRAAMSEALEAEYATPFDLTAGPLIRATLFRCAEADHLLAITIHHLVSDAWSQNLLRDELARFYAHEIGVPCELPAPISIRYSDYAHWHRRWHETESYRSQIDYWHEKLSSVPVDGAFPTDTGAFVYSPGSMHYVEVDAGEIDRLSLRSWLVARGETPYVMFMSALMMALNTYSGLATHMVYSPVAGRSRQELEETIGLYVNMITVVASVDPDLTIDGLIARVDRDVREAQANADVSMMVMMQKAAFPLPAMPSVVLNVIELPNDADWLLHGLTVAPVELQRDGKPCLTGLDVVVKIQGGKIRVHVGRNDALFSAETGQRIAFLLLRALRAMVATPRRPVVEAMRIEGA